MSTRLGGLALVAIVAAVLNWQRPEIQRYLKVRKM
jgi:hypothetical protein